MALGKRGGRALVVLLLCVTIAVLLLPASVLELVWQHQQGCPLGYTSADGSNPHLSDPPPELTPSTPPASQLTLFVNATVWTADPQTPRAEAFVVSSGKGGGSSFVHVGSSASAAATVAGKGAGLVDLGGAHVIPGIIDAHLHLIDGGRALARLNLGGARSKQAFVDAVAGAAAQAAPGAWVLGGAWEESGWGGELPSAAWIDAVSPHNPVWLTRMDLHMGLANSVALQMAGITADTPDPAGGLIARDPGGAPTGLLADNAIHLLSDFIPRSTLEERRSAFKAAVQHALSKGITTVIDMGRLAMLEGEEAAWDDLEEIYAPAASAGELPLRIYSFVPLSTWRRLAERVAHLGTSHPGGRLFWGGLKDFLDGSLGSSTALFHEPYSDDPKARGMRAIELERVQQLVAAADAAGLQVALHAIGDRAVDDAVALFAALATNSSSKPGPRRAPHRIEHAQHLSSPAAAARMAAAGVVATPNPQHLLADAPLLERRLGRERAGAGRAYAFRTLQAAGVTTAFASDWPVVPLDPLAGSLYAAVHRQAPPAAGGDGVEHVQQQRQSWGAEEALTVEEALAGHTVAGAEAAGLKARLGNIQQGQWADFVVLAAAPEAAPGVLQTYVGGRCAWGCASAAPPADSLQARLLDEL